MRQLASEFQARLDGGATTMCRCWLLSRTDGVTLGFTDHDSDLTFAGEVFKAASGMDAGAMQASSGLSVDSGRVNGALKAQAIRAEDIGAGKYDGARVQQWLVDWQEPEQRVVLFTGYLGEIKRGSTAFEAELRGLSEVLNKPIGRAYLRQCDRVLGDARCGVDLSAVTVSATILNVVAANEFVAVVDKDDDWFTGGIVVWGDGRRGLIKSDRLAAVGRRIALWQATPMQTGDTVQLVAGCDKAAATCKTKFGNLLNFRGFHHMPGDDWVLSYPGKGEKLDGGSLYRGQ